MSGSAPCYCYERVARYAAHNAERYAERYDMVDYATLFVAMLACHMPRFYVYADDTPARR